MDRLWIRRIAAWSVVPNQDAFFIDNRLGVWVVADGMGGHVGGDIASRLVIDTLRFCFHSLPERRAHLEASRTKVDKS